MYFYKLLPTQVGELTLIAGEQGLAAVAWENEPPARIRARPELLSEEHPVLLQAAEQLTEYFAGDRKCFDLPLQPEGTLFQRQVWQALAEIPYGETRSYRDIAARIGRPKAVRAVGGANGRNPLSIIIPCHRVIGADGSLTGFAGGTTVKQQLLQLEASGLR
ncbi:MULTISPECIES: methylated-DNA--[protein]-cysteine S-methyltransferase [Tatumella]|uniref:Methylated-DNA--protein-cysteine methyltransferase n=1 Tax=Tatumella punctata TaxID=399969 RepID=A0ABW1VM70_9GAMM|nr:MULTISPECIES: methylated-DNA--[protein]-cysteine S-methyltransferase [unclassified Tatumella]MBS0854634.1 methylated-DNA--[protein]-cysteine S-methyltransferase [Tatumella sp. JGM16]MBS0875903.1 methylated-DNA--[protein]-cysteine S-methyltransferase [Tatumella sp. JGM82]MBS0890308.1 methylated-DNA--[protein]-cysteine S-methyltransferase [Tatumella sp. JGM94]MBS0892585.1 methylated-DNA--[protein]-cysteine S-methyltransferase [Tatumella sp. JGM130]MBS0900434.1 methylated-DNA--[protein]-cystei